MPIRYSTTSRSLITVLMFCLAIILFEPVARAQSPETLEGLKQQADELMKQLKYTEALPLIEKILVAEPSNPEMHYYLGFALISQGKVTIDSAERKALRVRARNAFIRAKELGKRDAVVDALIGGMDPNGSDGADFSKNILANALMVQAEGYFGGGKLDEALANYQRALELDPTIYEAALFSGDVFMHREKFSEAEVWYQRAIKINPNRETAYRYSATPLMKQRKFDEARDRYIEAFITEPYSKFSRAGLIQWAQATNTGIAHPKIDIPTDVTFIEKGEANINLDASALLGGKDDGSFAWISYGATRSTWHKERFAKTFPSEKTYRHSLPEEADALRSVLAIATTDGKSKKLSPSLAKLKKLNDAGLLEAFILITRPDEGIVQDFASYLKENRDKLRRYVVEYIMTGGGN